MIPSDDFPNLNQRNHQVTSPADVGYNCVAWSAANTEHWWQPGIFWPVKTSRENHGIAALEEAFKALGYEDCLDDSLEAGFEKVVLYGSGLLYTHAARQLPDGRWTSKLGKAEDIEHDTPDAVAGGLYGEVVQFMKRTLANS